MTDEHVAFSAYCSRPSAETLIDLLRASQDRVFRLCYHVLRNTHDAEDASQGVFLAIVGNARRFPDPESFRRWLHRVCLNAALEWTRKSGRRRDHETRAAMEKPVPEPLDDATRLSLFDAIYALDDEPRNLLLDHYFDGDSLEMIARRAGVSAPAICKKLDEARESLRRRLAGAGVLIPLPELGTLFPKTPPVPDLLTDTVLAQVQATTTAAGGGAVLASKPALYIGLALVAVFGAAVGSRQLSRSSAPSTPHISKAPTSEQVKPHPGNSGDSGAVTTEVSSPIEATGSTLRSRLVRFRTWHAEKMRALESLRLDQKAQFAMLSKKQREAFQELEGVTELVLKDPGTFFRFLKDPENEACVAELTDYGFGFYRWNGEEIPWGMKLDVDRFPRAIVDGFFDVLRTGSSAVKCAALGFFANLQEPPADFTPHWTAMINDADTRVGHRAVQLVMKIRSLPPEVAEAIFKVGRTSPDVEVRRETAAAMHFVPGPEAQAYLLERIETVADPYEASSFVSGMYSKFYAAARGGPAVDETRFLRALTGMMNRGLESGTLKIVVGAALIVAPAKSRGVVERARAVAPDLECRDAINRVLQKIDAGVTDQAELNKLLWASP